MHTDMHAWDISICLSKAAGRKLYVCTEQKQLIGQTNKLNNIFNIL